LTDNSLQSADKDQQETRAVAEKPHDAVVKFDAYRCVQRHHAVLPATALLLFNFLVANAMSQIQVVHVGSTVTFSYDKIDVNVLLWEFVPTNSQQPLDVFHYPNITPKFVSRFSVSGNNLSINNVQLCDAGRYRCSFPSGDKVGIHNFELIVLGK